MDGGLPCDPSAWGRGGSGGAARPPERTLAPGHCRVPPWASGAEAPAAVSGIAVPVAETPPAASVAAAPATDPPAATVESAVRRAKRVARAPLMLGATTLAAVLVTRRKPRVDSRRLTWARWSAPSMP
ncbi:MAG TPA: hypothetical protein VFE59_11225 [Trebonia sp.]|nr:hypothetical protein [Trebonia sp.]